MDRTLNGEEIEMMDTLYFKNCTNCQFVVGATCTKIFVEACQNFTLRLNDRVITSTVEVWKCENLTMEVGGGPE